MAKKTRRIRRYFKKHFRRRPKTIPFEMLIGGVSLPFVQPRPMFESPVEAMQRGDPKRAMEAVVCGFTGFDPSFPQAFNLMSALNPLDFNDARYWKLLLWTGIIGSVRKKIVKNSSVLFRKIPIVGRWVS